MANNRNLAKETFYHVYNRGFNKQLLFLEEYDFKRFLENFSKYKKEYPSIHIYAFCVLPNHFHFLLKEAVQETGLEIQDRSLDISEFMRKISVSYAMFFNKKYGDTIKKGLKSPVFEGRFKVKEVVTEEYLDQVKTYIEYNAVKHEIVEDVTDWAWSSYGLKKGDRSLKNTI